ncbi:MAG: divergent PAP2 family protein, partial [Oscillospiraceae bacterium]
MFLYKMALQSNYILTVAASAWFIAQILKAIINFAIKKKFSAERLIGSGGMPSSHSALVCAMVVSTGKLLGTNSPLFAITM